MSSDPVYIYGHLTTTKCIDGGGGYGTIAAYDDEESCCPHTNYDVSQGGDSKEHPTEKPADKVCYAEIQLGCDLYGNPIAHLICDRLPQCCNQKSAEEVFVFPSFEETTSMSEEHLCCSPIMAGHAGSGIREPTAILNGKAHPSEANLCSQAEYIALEEASGSDSACEQSNTVVGGESICVFELCGYSPESCTISEDLVINSIFGLGMPEKTQRLVGFGACTDIGAEQGDITLLKPDLTTGKATAIVQNCSDVAVCACCASDESATEGAFMLTLSPKETPCNDDPIVEYGYLPVALIKRSECMHSNCILVLVVLGQLVLPVVVLGVVVLVVFDKLKLEMPATETNNCCAKSIALSDTAENTIGLVCVCGVKCFIQLPCGVGPYNAVVGVVKVNDGVKLGATVLLTQVAAMCTNALEGQQAVKGDSSAASELTKTENHAHVLVVGEAKKTPAGLVDGAEVGDMSAMPDAVKVVDAKKEGGNDRYYGPVGCEGCGRGSGC